MEAKLAAKHPDIKTWAGRGVDDRTATIRADITKLGFHASVRSKDGAYFVDPRERDDDSVYLSYFARDLSDDERFVEREADELAPQVEAATALARPRGPAAHLPARADHGPELRHLPRRRRQRHRGQGHAHQPRQPDLRGRVGDPDGPDRRQRQAQPQHSRSPTLPTARAGRRPASRRRRTPAGAMLDRNRYVIGQIVGASAYDIGHIAMGNAGGGVACAGVGDNDKARGCTGLATPIGDYFAVDYVAHEMGHQFSAPHTFNGILGNCGGNRSGASSVELGSGSSIMAYAGICGRDNIQPHSDPYWVPQSYQTILTWVTLRPRADQRGADGLAARLRRHGLGHARTTTARRSARSCAARTTPRPTSRPRCPGNEVQRVALAGYDTDGDSYTLTFRGATSHPIVRGQNNTAAGIAERDPGRQRAAAGHADELHPGHAVVHDLARRQHVDRDRPRRRDGQQRQHPGRDQRHRRLPRRRDGGQRRQRRASP